MLVKAVMTFNGSRVEGVFHFLPSGECTRFDTWSRTGSAFLPGFAPHYFPLNGVSEAGEDVRNPEVTEVQHAQRDKDGDHPALGDPPEASSE